MRYGASACMVTRNTRPSKMKSLTYTGASMSCTAEYTSRNRQTHGLRLFAVERQVQLRRGRQLVRLHTGHDRALARRAHQRAQCAIQRRPARRLAVLEPELEAAEIAKAGDGREVEEQRHAVFLAHTHAKGPLVELRGGGLAILVVLQLDEEHADALTAADETEAGDFEHRVHRVVGAQLFADALHELRACAAGRYPEASSPCRW